jgi:lysophospholipase L1-like esterase
MNMEMESTRAPSASPAGEPESAPPISQQHGRNLWSAIAVYLYSLLVAILLLLVSEGLLRMFWPQEKQIIISEWQGTKPVSWGIKDDVLGHRLQPNTEVVERAPEFTVRYATNDQGFRAGPKLGESAAPTQETERILVVGDSFAFGYASNWSDTWTARTERYLKAMGMQVEVINAGVPGYDTRSETLLLERVIERYQPSVVLLAFLPNDLFTNSPISRSEAMRQEVDNRVAEIRGAKLGGLHSVNLAKRAVMSFDRAYSQLYLLTQRKEYFILPLSAHGREQVKTTEELLERANQIAQRSGARLVVLSIPQLFQVIHAARGYDFPGVDSYWVDRHFGGHAVANDYEWIPTLDQLAELYRGGETDLYYRFDGHLTPEGNDVIARLLVHAADKVLSRTPQRADPTVSQRDAQPAERGATEAF